MSICKSHKICLSENVYENEGVCHILCQVLHCPGVKCSDLPETLFLSSQEEIKACSTVEKRKNASEVLLCLLANLPHIPKNLCKGLFDLCQQGFMDKKMLYYALVARADLDILTTFLDHERPFLRSVEDISQGFSAIQSTTFMDLVLLTVKKQQHWLLLLLDQVPLLLKHGDVTKVENLLSLPHLQFLWPLLFLRMLEDGKDIISLKVCCEHTIQNKECEPSIKELAVKLVRFLNVVLWIRENGVSCQPVSEFHIQTSSIINIIDNCCNISDLDWKKTHEFLVVNATDEGYVAKWEIALFDAFCACNVAFEYIMTCMQSKHLDESQCENTKSLDLLKAILSQLHPLSVRLRIMENIFSLLFIRHEDFQEEICSDSEEGEIDNNMSLLCNEDMEANISCNILSSSLTSVTNTIEFDNELESKAKIFSENARSLPKSFNQKHGFVCDRFMARDLLKLLESCLTDSEDFRVEFTIEEEAFLSKKIFAQPFENQVENGFASLRNKVAFALWKLEVLLGQNFVQQRSSKESVLEKISFPNWVFQHCLDDDSASDDDCPPMRKSSVIQRKSEVEKSSESGSQSNLTSHGQGLNSKWSHKGRRRSSVRICARNTRDTTIKRMLSSKQSFITHCISRGDLSTAKEIVQVLEMEESSIAAEVHFTDAYQAIKQKVRISANSYKKQDNSDFKALSPNSTLQAIQRAASAGVQASSFHKEVEKLLSSPNLPCIWDVHCVSNDFLHLFGGCPGDQPAVATAVDIALILSSSLQQAANFLSIVSKVSDDMQNMQTSPRSRPMGYLPLIHNILQITIADPMSPTELFHRWDVPNFLSRNLRDTLQFWDSLTKLLSEQKKSRSIALLYSKFFQLAALYHCTRGTEVRQEYHYLQDFKSYLKLLKVCRDQSIEPLPDMPLTEDHFLLLERSPFKLLSFMVLEEGAAPQNLEGMAAHIGCSLPHILSLELCSALPSVPPAKSYIHLSNMGSSRGVKILNSFDSYGPSRHPMQAVESLLSSVYNELSSQLKLIQKLYQTEDGYILTSLINVKQIQSILDATWELRDIDLRLLQPGAETLAFHCNLANLMWIHCLVFLSSMSMADLSSVCLESLIGGNSTQQLAAMNSFAYQVGQFGILTLWEVRRLALGVHLMKPQGTKALQEYASVTDSFDPLALFTICSGSKYSPKLRVLSSNNLEEQLQKSVQDYVQYWADKKTECVVVPSLIHQYIQSTRQNMQVFIKDFVGDSCEEKRNIFSECFQVSCFPEEAVSAIVLEYGPKSTQKISQVEENIISWKFNDNLQESVLQYIKDACPAAALLLQELRKETSNYEDKSDSEEEAQEATENTVVSTQCYPSLQQYSCLDRLCKRFEIAAISQVFNHNVLLSALHNVVPHKLVWESLNQLAEEKRWHTIVDLLRAMPHIQLQCDPMLSVVQDLALLELALECRGSGQPWLYCDQMDSLYFQAKCILTESIYWPGNVCIEQLKKIMQVIGQRDYPALFFKVEMLMKSISLYQKIIDDCGQSPWKSWQEVRSVSQKNPTAVLDQIVKNQNAELCVSWIDLHKVTSAYSYLIDSKVIVLLLNDPKDRLQTAEQLLQCIPIERAAKICLEAFDTLCRLPALQFCVRFLSTHCTGKLSASDTEALEIVSLGIRMIKSVPAPVQSECLELVRNPHLMIEQLIMNVQLEAAEQMLNAVRSQIKNLSSKSPLSIPALDSLVRQYAEKALEFRISQGSTASGTSENSVLLASLSSCSDIKDHLMPAVVPSKAVWIPNDQATVCMNCQISSFTMFNRRHHCRRCGRVVCAQCSTHKMLIQGYGTLKVRVCNSCHSKISESEITQNSDQLTATIIESNVSLSPENVWHLSNSLSSNDTVRGEFAFENAPSVSLCLSILKLHSESAACPNFLVDSCQTILSYLQPQGGIPNPEVDYGFVIEMCRSLVVAAKVKCAQWGYISDEPNCDQRLSKIDLLELLVSHGCAALIPNETTTLRRLQTQLLEAELWELALEVSTKAGLEKIGVWTSWGKGCLRAGRWKEAREKFAHCFPSSNRINKSAPDSPLLLDILQILESAPSYVDQKLLLKADAIQMHSGKNRLARAPAIAVLNSLASLESISQGKLIQTQGGNVSLQPRIYSECCYYLKEYGSHATYLQFLVNHADFEGIVGHTLSHSVDPHIFFESVYMPCLRRGQITPLHSAMTAVDPSLKKWTTYLHGICAALEKRKLLHTLYEVQQWSKDHIRAAMTCIRFYHVNAKSYLELSANVNHLKRAQSHLEGALAVAVASKLRGAKHSESNLGPSASSIEEGSEAIWLQLSPKEIDHHMNTIERQKELTKFLSAYEAKGCTLFEAAQWFPYAYAEPLAHGLPTLFGSTANRMLLAGLCLFCGKNVEEGYGIVYRIIEGFHLTAHEIYEAVAIALYRSGRLTDVSQLLNCIRSSGLADPSGVCDSVLMACALEMSNKPNAISDVDFIARNIVNQAVKIKAFIVCGQLKSAYLLAVKYERLNDVETILQEAERLGQVAIKNICLKRLGRM